MSNLFTGSLVVIVSEMKKLEKGEMYLEILSFMNAITDKWPICALTHLNRWLADNRYYDYYYNVQKL